MRDLFNRIKVSRLLDPVAVVTDNTASVSQIVDLAGYESAVIVIETGNLTDADAVFSIKVEEGNDSGLSDAATVAAKDLQIDPGLTATPATGNQAAYDFSADTKPFKVGYIGAKRYLRVTITPANNTGNHFVAAAAVLSNARHQPAGLTQTP